MHPKNIRSADTPAAKPSSPQKTVSSPKSYPDSDYQWHIWRNPKYPQPLDDYRAQVSAQLLRLYAITIEDAGIDPEMLDSAETDGLTPEELVRWFGRKFDLTEAESR